MSECESVRIVLEAFNAVEQRDEPRLVRLYHPDVEFHWPAFRHCGIAPVPGPG
jgi:hypothetical protein